MSDFPAKCMSDKLRPEANAKHLDLRPIMPDILNELDQLWHPGAVLRKHRISTSSEDNSLEVLHVSTGGQLVVEYFVEAPPVSVFEKVSNI